MMLARLAAGALSPGGRRAALSILIFHRVLLRPDPLLPDEPDAESFDRQLSWLGRMFTVLPLDQAVAALAAGTLPPRAAAITFDDGYADNATVALPLLRRHGMSATFFVACDFLDGGRMWNDSVIEIVRRSPGDELDLESCGLGRHATRTPAERRLAIRHLLRALKYLPPGQREAQVAQIGARCTVPLPFDLMMTVNQVRMLHRAGMTIGGHTLSHPILARLRDEDAFVEIAGCKERLESMLQKPVTLFAYPNGKPDQDYTARHREMVERAGFKAAVSTSAGAARPGADLFQLPRFTPWDRSAFRYGLRMVRNLRSQGVAA